MIEESKIKAFISLMTESEAQSQYGFDLISKRNDLLDFYAELENKGFFGISEIQKSGAYQYLQHAAIKASSTNNIEISKKIISTLTQLTKDVSSLDYNKNKENYWIIFARTLCELPISAISLDTINLLKEWFNDERRYATDAELGLKLARKLTEEPSESNREKICALLKYLTTIYWSPDKFTSRQQPKFIMNDYCISKLFKKMSSKIGGAYGESTANILIENLSSIINNENKDREPLESWVWLPAIENNKQNIIIDECKPILVFAIRDILISWMESTDFNLEYLKQLLSSKLDIIRRVAIFLINTKFETIKNVIDSIINPNIFQYNHLHESYHFLKNRFAELDPNTMDLIFKSIKQLPEVKTSKDPELTKLYLQRRYLHAIYNQGLNEADQLFEDLNNKKELGSLNENPDFYAYMESWQTNDSSPYTTSQLIDFTNKGTLIQNLNKFREFNELRSPNVRGLVRTLEETIKTNPIDFIELNNEFLNANRPYQYGFINAFKTLWDTPNEQINFFDWDKIWQNLFSFFEKINTDSLWDETTQDNGDLIPKSSWIPPLIADFIKSGMAKDKHAFNENLMPKALKLIKSLLARSEEESNYDNYKSDAMTTSINCTRGKVIESLVNYSLRASRINDNKTKSHSEAWAEVEPIFNLELDTCKNGNYVFSTLMGSYIENLNYLSKEWVKSNFNKLFPNEFPDNLNCAIQGLAYSQNATKETYKLLKENNIFKLAADIKDIDSQIKQHFIQRIALAYLWGDEVIDSDLLSFYFDNNRTTELTIIVRFFWSMQNQDLDEKYVKRIIDFWEHCANWAKEKSSDEMKDFLSDLGTLCCYLDEIDGKSKERLLLSAPYIGLNSRQNDMDYSRNLSYLADKSPLEVLEILEVYLESNEPYYDYGSYFHSILKKLYQNTDISHRSRVHALCNKFTNNIEIRELYKEYNHN